MREWILRTVLFYIFLLASQSAPAKDLSIENIRLGGSYSEKKFYNFKLIAAGSSNISGTFSYIKFALPNETQISITVQRPDNEIVFIEQDWINRNQEVSLRIHPFVEKSFILGSSNFQEIQGELEIDGFHYACARDTILGGAFISIWSFENPVNPDQIINFVFEISDDLMTQGLIPKTALGEEIETGRRHGILVAAIIAEKEYLENHWCSERIPWRRPGST